MAEFDLIPEDYRIQLWRDLWLKRFGFAVLALVSLHATGYGVLIYSKGMVKSEVEKLQVMRTITKQQTTELVELREQKAQYEYQWRLLTGLRSGTTAEHMFSTIDRSLAGDELWFLNWRFRRAGVNVNPEQKTSNSGYFVVIPQDEQESGSQAWQIETHMQIRGQAKDHSALSRFVKSLFEQPEIHNVRVLKTSLRRYAATSVVDFDLAVVVNSNIGSG